MPKNREEKTKRCTDEENFRACFKHGIFSPVSVLSCETELILLKYLCKSCEILCSKQALNSLASRSSTNPKLLIKKSSGNYSNVWYFHPSIAIGNSRNKLDRLERTAAIGHHRGSEKLLKNKAAPTRALLRPCLVPLFCKIILDSGSSFYKM